MGFNGSVTSFFEFIRNQSEYYNHSVVISLLENLLLKPREHSTCIEHVIVNFQGEYESLCLSTSQRINKYLPNVFHWLSRVPPLRFERVFI